MQTAGERRWNPMSTNFAHARVLAGHCEQYARGAAAAGRPGLRAQAGSTTVRSWLARRSRSVWTVPFGHLTVR